MMKPHETTCENCIYCQKADIEEIFTQSTCAAKGELIRDITQTCGHFIHKDRDKR